MTSYQFRALKKATVTVTFCTTTCLWCFEANYRFFINSIQNNCITLVTQYAQSHVWSTITFYPNFLHCVHFNFSMCSSSKILWGRILLMMRNWTLKKLFIQYNTTLPSSAAVERLFSLGKDILKPKRCGLSDEHFEMLAFLKGNKLISVFKIFVTISAYF